jgi:pyridoxal phosphate-dependent aminotransferase EpsN
MSNDRIYLSRPHMGGSEQLFINDAFKKNWIAPLGDNVNNFEKKMQSYTGAKSTLALSSGTAAIHLALIESGVKQNDVVFCSSLTFCATANPILYLQARPVFIDSELVTWNMCPKSLEKALQKYTAMGQKPKAVIVVNLYGQTAQFDKIIALCNKYDVTLIEDAAESLGSTFKDKMSGTLGDFGIFSFNGNKIITTSGGGMLLSHNKKAIKHALFLATQARDDASHYQHSELGFNYRLSNICAGIGLGQLEVLTDRVNQRRAIFKRYAHALQVKEVKFQIELNHTLSNRWLTAFVLTNNDNKLTPMTIINKLAEHNIEARRIWKPMHMQPLYNDYDFISVAEDNAQAIFERGVCLPSSSDLTIAQQDKVIEIVKSIIETHKKNN